MSSIMMDRWSIDSSLKYLNNDYIVHEHHFDEFIDYISYDHRINYNDFIQQCWHNFLTAIILWDEIWTFHYETYYDWNRIIGQDKEDLAQKLYGIIHQVERNSIAETEKYICLLLNDRIIRNTNDIYERALFYQIISNSLCVPYLAHPSRKEFILFTESALLYSRLDEINRVDQELMEYYDEINHQLNRYAFRFEYPILIDIVRKDADTPYDELNAALTLRNDKDTVIFRNQLYHIEQSIQKGNTQLILSELKMVTDLAKEITNRYQKNVSIGEFTLSLSPSLSIPIKVSKKRPLHATFIKHLIEHGVYNRY